MKYTNMTYKADGTIIGKTRYLIFKDETPVGYFIEVFQPHRNCELGFYGEYHNFTFKTYLTKNDIQDLFDLDKYTGFKSYMQIIKDKKKFLYFIITKNMNAL